MDSLKMGVIMNNESPGRWGKGVEDTCIIVWKPEVPILDRLHYTVRLASEQGWQVECFRLCETDTVSLTREMILYSPVQGREIEGAAQIVGASIDWTRAASHAIAVKQFSAHIEMPVVIRWTTRVKIPE